MHTSIVVPLDGSEFGTLAIPVARALALRSDAFMHLVHVREPFPTPSGGPPDTNAFDAPQRRSHADLEAIAAGVARDASLRVDLSILDGPVVPALQAYLADGRHDLVVMMTHGRGGLRRLWLGNVAAGLIQHVSTPLLLLRRDNAWLLAPDEPLFHRILIPLDGSPRAESVIERVLSLATPDETVHVLLTVIVSPLPDAESPGEAAIITGSADEDRQREDALDYLHAIAEELRAAGALAEIHVDRHPRDARGILAAAEEHRADLIALSTHGRGSVSRLARGSVADRVVRGATVPVLIYRPDPHHGSPHAPGRHDKDGADLSNNPGRHWTSPGTQTIW